MKRKRHSPEQIIRKLREAESMLSAEKTIGQDCQALEVSEQTGHRWQSQYGGMKVEEAKRLKELENENKRLNATMHDRIWLTSVEALQQRSKGTDLLSAPLWVRARQARRWLSAYRRLSLRSSAIARLTQLAQRRRVIGEQLCTMPTHARYPN